MTTTSIPNSNLEPQQRFNFLANPSVRLGVKLGMIGALLLVMMAPLSMIRSTVWEREGRLGQAVREIASQWGGAQHLAGPILAVPIKRVVNVSQPVVNPQTGQREEQVVRRWHTDIAYLLPKSAVADGTIAGDTRRRGLFSATVFTAGMKVSGQFEPKTLVDRLGPDVNIDWCHARLLAGVGDMTGVRGDEPLQWQGQALKLSADSDPQRPALFEQAVMADLPVIDPTAGALRFALAVDLRGSEDLKVATLAESSAIKLDSNWPAPGFTDAPIWSPTETGGFSAEWHSSALNRLVPAVFLRDTTMKDSASSLRSSLVGVSLTQPITTYARVLRAANYAVLFLALTFLAYLLAEGLGGVKIHIIQYGMVGLSLSLFVLLLMALAEQIGFAIAYATAALLIIAQTGFYTLAVTRNRLLAVKVTALIAMLYGFLYVTLNIENQALLAGTLALYAGLSAMMFATRRLDRWGQSA